MTSLFSHALVRESGSDIGSQRVFRFDNGYGASVVCGPYTYGGAAGLYELAVILWDDETDDYSITYDTPLTDDVLGWLSTTDVDQRLSEIAALPAVAS